MSGALTMLSLTDRPRRKWNLSLLTVAVTAIGLAGLIPFILEMSTQAALLPRVEQRIGAQIGSPYVTLGKQDREVIVFSAVKAGSPTALAGIANGDIVVEDVSIGGLCRRFDQSVGKTVVVRVTTGGNGPELDLRTHRDAKIVLP